MANFFFYRYHFVQLDEPDLLSEAEEGVTDFDERHNPRFAEDVAMNADGIGKLNLFNFKVDKKTGEQTSVQYENDILHCLVWGGVVHHTSVFLGEYPVVSLPVIANTEAIARLGDLERLQSDR